MKLLLALILFLPLSSLFSQITFEENVGQFLDETGKQHKSVKFISNGSNQILFSKKNVIFRVPEKEGDKVKQTNLRMSFVSSSPSAEIIGLEKRPEYVNYYLHNIEAEKVPVYSKVLYKNIYPRIDAVFYDNGKGELEYDFIVSPGADPKKIALKFDNANKVMLNDRGELEVSLGSAKLTKIKPHTYQEGSEIQSGVRVGKDKTIRFDIGSYDRSKVLTIDPIVKVFGLTLMERGEENHIAIDEGGNSYLASDRLTNVSYHSKNPDFSFSGNLDDNLTVHKLSRNGALLWKTVLGGDGADIMNDITLDNKGNVILAAYTYSKSLYKNMQGTPGDNSFSEALAYKLGPEGSYLKGFIITGKGHQGFYGVTVDENNNYYFVGRIEDKGDLSIDPEEPDDNQAESILVKTNENLLPDFSKKIRMTIGAHIQFHKEKLYLCYSSVAGMSDSFGNTTQGTYDFLIDVLDLKGKVLKRKIFGGSNDEIPGGFDISDDRIRLWGSTTSGDILNNVANPFYASENGNPNSRRFPYLIHFDMDFNPLWGCIVGGSAYYEEREFHGAFNSSMKSLIYFSGDQSLEEYNHYYKPDITEEFYAYRPYIYQFDKDGKLEFSLPLMAKQIDLATVGYYNEDILFFGYDTAPVKEGDYKGKDEDYGYMYFSYMETKPGKANKTEICAGSELNYTFTLNSEPLYDVKFVLQLSDKNGNFDNPVTIGEKMGKKGTTIEGIIPENTEEGSEYYLRVVTDDKFTVAKRSQTKLEISSIPEAVITETSELACLGKAFIYSTETIPGETISWSVIGGGIEGETTGNEVSIIWTKKGTGKVILSKENDASCIDRDTLVIDILPQTDLSFEKNTTVCRSDDAQAVNLVNPQGGTYSGDIITDNKYSFEGREAGLYNVVYAYVNDAGCDTLVIIEVTLNDNPAPGQISWDGDLLVSSEDTGNQWYKDKKKIEGADGNSYKPETAGKYSVKIISEAGCESDFSNELDYLISVEETDNTITVSPNPTKGMVHIKSGIELESIDILDITGNRIEAGIIRNGNGYDVDLGIKTAGTYFLRVIRQGNSHTFKIVKE